MRWYPLGKRGEKNNFAWFSGTEMGLKWGLNRTECCVKKRNKRVRMRQALQWRECFPSSKCRYGWEEMRWRVQSLIQLLPWV